MSSTPHALLHDLRNGLGRLSACAELMALRRDDLDAEQQARIERMRTIIRELASVTGALERRVGDDEAPDTHRDDETRPEAAAAKGAGGSPPTPAQGSPGGSPLASRHEAVTPHERPVTQESVFAPTQPSSRRPDSQPTLRSDTERPEDEGNRSATGMMVAETYRIGRLLGRGGMGSVWLARDTQLHRDVALKLVDHVDWGGLDARKVFLREARAMAQVQSPHVVTIHAFGEHQGVPYFVMEYVPGTSLERLLSLQDGHLAFDQAIGVADQVCRGVEAIHRAGALHCDIKPANVLIGPSFHVAVADLGLARTVGERRGTTGGTPGYVAPEIIADHGRVPDERADIYAVGALAYKLLTGKSAFRAQTVAETLQLQLDDRLAPPSAVSDVPAAFDAILERALSRDPKHRHPSAEALRRELSAARDELPRTYRQTTVFLVDDDPVLREHGRALVEAALPGARVRVFSDGRRALDAAEREGLPNMAVVDLEMPDINGIELTAALKSQPGGGQVEVVMLTGAASARDWEVLQRLGASGFLFKPVDESELSTLMRRLAITDDSSGLRQPAAARHPCPL